MVSCMGCVSESHLYMYLSSKSHLLDIYVQLEMCSINRRGTALRTQMFCHQCWHMTKYHLVSFTLMSTLPFLDKCSPTVLFTHNVKMIKGVVRKKR